MAQRQWRSDDTDKWKESFGKGVDGSTYSAPANEGCSGTSGTKTLTLATAGSFANDDLILIHQSRGTAAGGWELNKILSGAGTTTLTLKYDLTQTYTDSGNSQAQCIEMKQYNGVTVGSQTVTGWDQSKGGIIAFFDKGTTALSGTVNNKGTVNNAEGSRVAGGGFVGGASYDSLNSYGGVGENYSTAGNNASPSAVANGGGGGGGNASFNAGGGGGNGTAGSAGEGSDSTNGAGGGTAGNAALTNMVFGGAGGGATGTAGMSNNVYGGVNGGGMAFIFSKDLVVTGSLNCSGTDRSSSNIRANGGGGAGGSILLKCETATLGTNLILAKGSVITSDAEKGGNGGAGRIHLDYSKSYTGTTTPTIDVTLDSTIKLPAQGGAFVLTSFV